MQLGNLIVNLTIRDWVRLICCVDALEKVGLETEFSDLICELCTAFWPCMAATWLSNRYILMRGALLYNFKPLELDML